MIESLYEAVGNLIYLTLIHQNVCIVPFQTLKALPNLQIFDPFSVRVAPPPPGLPLANWLLSLQ